MAHQSPSSLTASFSHPSATGEKSLWGLFAGWKRQLFVPRQSRWRHHSDRVQRQLGAQPGARTLWVLGDFGVHTMGASRFGGLVCQHRYHGPSARMRAHVRVGKRLIHSGPDWLLGNRHGDASTRLAVPPKRWREAPRMHCQPAKPRIEPYSVSLIHPIGEVENRCQEQLCENSHEVIAHDYR